MSLVANTKMSLHPLELVMIAKEISDISALGLLLNFGESNMDAFKKENDKDLTLKEGTQKMLRLWNQKVSSTKARLVEALKLSGMEILAIRVEEGILSEDQKKFVEQTETPSALLSTVLTVETNFDGILKTVAGKVVMTTEIDNLGSALGFSPEDIQRYIATNSRYHNITYSGTLEMLRDWRKKQVRSTERSALKMALEASGFIHLADQIFGEGIGQTSSGETLSALPGPSSSASVRASPQGAISADSLDVPTVKTSSNTVSDGKLNALARHVPHGKYSDLSEELGIDYNQATGILAKHGSDSTKAIRECLGIWKDKTGGISAELKKILNSAEVGGSLVKYIE